MNKKSRPPLTSSATKKPPARKSASSKNTVPAKKGAPAKKSAPRRPREGQSSFETQLRAAIATVDVSYTLTTPLVRSLENLLRLAARTLNSAEASVLVRDGEGGGLKFMVAIGAVAHQLAQVRIPPGKGIAGFVFASGQPMVVADATRERTFYPEIDRVTGYSTQTILATPLLINGETVGVLEFVNRRGQPPHESFAPHEMDWAARFADSIATLVEAHETAGLIETLFARTLEGARRDRADEERGQPHHDASGELQSWLKTVQAAPEHRDLLSLAVSLQAIAARGEAERHLCRDMLEAIARWTDRRRTSESVGYLF
jgi:signal transduction protein with GAF and PtsI domain